MTVQEVLAKIGRLTPFAKVVRVVLVLRNAQRHLHFAQRPNLNEKFYKTSGRFFLSFLPFLPQRRNVNERL